MDTDNKVSKVFKYLQVQVFKVCTLNLHILEDESVTTAATGGDGHPAGLQT